MDESIFRHSNSTDSKKTPRYDDGKRTTAICDDEELQRSCEEFEAQYAVHKSLTKTFWQRAYEVMEAMHWNSTIFCNRTLLSEKTYSRLKNNTGADIDIRTVMAICVGLDLDISMTNKLLAYAGYVLNSSREHQAYIFIITRYRGKSIHERNKFLETLRLQPLGSRQEQ